MVPYARALSAIVLSGYAVRDDAFIRRELSSLYAILFPPPPWDAAFVKDYVDDRLKPETRIALETAQCAVTRDYGVVFDAAEELGVASYVALGNPYTAAVSSQDPSFVIPDFMYQIRTHERMRFAIDSMLLCRIPEETVSSDVYKLFGVMFEPEQIEEYRQLFADVSFLKQWHVYALCVSSDVYNAQRRMVQEHQDFVRWKLGVPVHLDAETVLDRLISEAYFTERLLKSQAPRSSDGLLPELSHADLMRIRMERDTIFKCLEKRAKIRSESSDPAVRDALQQLQLLRVEYTEHQFPTKEELGTS